MAVYAAEVFVDGCIENGFLHLYRFFCAVQKVDIDFPVVTGQTVLIPLGELTHSFNGVCAVTVRADHLG